MSYKTYKTYKLYVGVMTAESPRPDLPPDIDVSFRPQELHIEVTVSHARAHLPELLDEVRDGTTIYLTRYGKRLAALVPAEAAEHLTHLEDTYWSNRATEAENSPDPPTPWPDVVAELEAADDQ